MENILSAVAYVIGMVSDLLNVSYFCWEGLGLGLGLGLAIFARKHDNNSQIPSCKMSTD